jgi:hypothetical protein
MDFRDRMPVKKVVPFISINRVFHALKLMTLLFCFLSKGAELADKIQYCRSVSVKPSLLSYPQQ